MGNLATVLGAPPGPQLGGLAMSLASGLAPVGIGLVALVAVGAIVILVGRDRRPPMVSPRPLHSEIMVEVERRVA